MAKRPKLDIHSQAKWPSSELSNFAAHPFILDGVACASMEGFLQALKFQQLDEQRRVCALSGLEAKVAGQGATLDWRAQQVLWWQGQPMTRRSAAYTDLLTRAYDAMFDANPRFRFALLVAGHFKLTHSIGSKDPTQTVLTEDELWSQLVRLRKRQNRSLLTRAV